MNAGNLSGISAAFCHDSNRLMTDGPRHDDSLSLEPRGVRVSSFNGEAGGPSRADARTPRGFCVCASDIDTRHSRSEWSSELSMSKQPTGASQSGAHALTTTTCATARTMTSRELAALAEKRHDNVMRVIESLEDAGLILPQLEEVPNEGAGSSRKSARTRTKIAPILKEAIREEQRADKALKNAADRFAKSVRSSSMAVANWGDGEGGYALETVREALISAGVFSRPERTTSNSARKPITANRRRAVFERDLYRCVCCGTHLELTIDHKAPVSLGGGNNIDNLQTMCMPCNAKKGVKLAI